MSGTFTGCVLTNPSECNGNGGQDGTVWIITFEAFVSTKRLGPGLRATFDSELPATEATVLDLTNVGEKTQDNCQNQNDMRAWCYSQCR